MHWWFCTIVLYLSAQAAFCATVRFALIGDYGVDDANELAVANLVRTNFHPDFVVTAGDNNYLTAAQTDQAIGKYYHQFIGNYMGSYGVGASSNQFFPALGNHDFQNGTYAAHLNYFTLPGNERYYDVAAGPVQIFICNSDVNEPDGTSSTSTQARWISNRVASATAPWKIVVIHDPPYSSSGSITRVRWPFRQWGAHAVVSGSSHNYERLDVSGFPYFVDGLGGASIAAFGTPLAESRVRYSAAHGAMLVMADQNQISFQFSSVASGGTLIDSFTITRPRLSITRVGGETNRISWPTNAIGFSLDSATNPVSSGGWTQLSATPIMQTNEFVVLVPVTITNRYFRLRKP